VLLRKISPLHILLFVLTFLSTMVAGALQKGINPLVETGRIMEGLPFSISLMLVLLSHELAHFFTSRAHRTDATLPYFIPAPFTIYGTFGAFIKMRSPIVTRKALVDIGASGPIVGFVVSVAASMIGLAHSEVVALEARGDVLSLGDSLMFMFLAKVALGIPPEGHDILLHPVAFAGWIGLFVTSLNLIPIGQLDGGHIAYALFGGAHSGLSKALVALLGVMGLLFWGGWAVWAVLMLVLGLRHPPVMYWEPVLDARRRFVGWLSLVIFLVTFIPNPITVSL
jgi:membrane-associated protease RseP (regulator of RpoE activity)